MLDKIISPLYIGIDNGWGGCKIRMWVMDKEVTKSKLWGWTNSWREGQRVAKKIWKQKRID